MKKSHSVKLGAMSSKVSGNKQDMRVLTGVGVMAITGAKNSASSGKQDVRNTRA